MSVFVKPKTKHSTAHAPPMERGSKCVLGATHTDQSSIESFSGITTIIFSGIALKVCSGKLDK